MMMLCKCVNLALLFRVIMLGLDHFSVSGIDCSVPVRNGERCEVKCVRPSQLSSNEKEEIFNLLQVNMKDLYEQTWGWNKDEKWKDVFHPESRLIVVSVSPISSEEFGTTEPSVKTISAFVAFRFTWDDEDEPEYPVVYVYELQIAATHHRLGIGQKLMRHCGDIARHWKMQKLVSYLLIFIL